MGGRRVGAWAAAGRTHVSMREKEGLVVCHEANGAIERRGEREVKEEEEKEEEEEEEEEGTGKEEEEEREERMEGRERKDKRRKERGEDGGKKEEQECSSISAYGKGRDEEKGEMAS